MRLLYTSTAYPPSVGGAQLHHHFLAKALRSRHSIQAICHWDSNRADWLIGTTLAAPGVSQNYEIDHIPVHRLGLSFAEKLQLLPFVCAYYPLMNIALPPIVDRLVPHLRPFATEADVIHNVRIGREGLSYASLQAARQQNIPFVFTPVHHPRWVGWRYRAYLKLYKLADAVIALTQVEKQTLMALGVPEDRIAVTGIGPILAPQPNPIEFLQRYSLRSPLILFLGQHYVYKGYQQLLAAAPIVWQHFPEANFVFVGPPVKHSERAFAQADPRIHRLGKVDLQTKTDAIAACTVLCVPSSQESFGGVYTEAWSLGKPVIGCNIPAVAEVIEEGVNGFLVQQDPAQIADRLLHLLRHPAQAAALGKAGQHKVATRFTWEVLSDRVEAVYKKLL